MSKSYNNTIGLREQPESVEQKLRTMPTDPARVRRTDPGDPGKCPVWHFHEVYSNAEVRQWVQDGCRNASIGCLDCKQPVIDAVLKEQAPIRERSIEFLADRDAVKAIIDEGCEAAREAARDTLDEVRQAMNLAYR
jgi:tryptophanyl-tRNA synthetase